MRLEPDLAMQACLYHIVCSIEEEEEKEAFTIPPEYTSSVCFLHPYKPIQCRHQSQKNVADATTRDPATAA